VCHVKNRWPGWSGPDWVGKERKRGKRKVGRLGIWPKKDFEI
jgi:hypothetical protein